MDVLRKPVPLISRLVLASIAIHPAIGAADVQWFECDASVVIPDADPRLYNHDLAPVAVEGRSWGVFSIFAMWMSDVHSVGGYTFAASLFFLGLTGWEVLLAMAVGITAVYFLMNLIGRPSLKYGTPFPVVARMAFGVMGANIAAGLRGIVGIVWYGVQTYFASKAVQVLVLAFYPSRRSLHPWRVSSACRRWAGSASCSCGCFSFWSFSMAWRRSAGSSISAAPWSTS